ncbi:DUF4381 domain-containing protein [Jhaorihella thermophila]|uniref:DUF4381 domain-containing protein n=1 Tax=Jhaorihella thermophila TaxID=488547 RepID=A0A1H5VSA7_9RHOB|nr:DUF4381 domain-containing protein [Jhaorihella thermophila]SEF90189.1 protein of unknown function [Jhaorihella thermophila]
MTTPATAPAESLTSLIAQLVPPAEPPPVSMMPQTAGWAVLGAAALAGLGFLAWRMWRTWRANAYRRAALRALGQAGGDPAAIAEILRRAALAAYPRRDVAGLIGEDWLAFLDETGPEAVFAHGPGRVLAIAPYRPVEDGGPALRAIAETWIRRHRREGGR